MVATLQAFQGNQIGRRTIGPLASRLASLRVLASARQACAPLPSNVLERL